MITTPLDQLRRAAREPARLTYLLGRADGYARQVGDTAVSDLLRKLAKCCVEDNVIANRLLHELNRNA